jgi:Capsule polysaccharide biosynthesis protein
MAIKVLCLSRSYLSKFLPSLETVKSELQLFHIVATDAEEKMVNELGGEVVLNIEAVVRKGLSQNNSPKWVEPADMRKITQFNWSPIYADRYLVNYSPLIRDKIAGILLSEFSGIFIKHKFAGFLSEPVAIFITNLLYYLCKKNDVKPLLWSTTFFNGYFYFADGMNNTNPSSKPNQTTEEIERISEDVKRHVAGVIADTAGPPNLDMFGSTKKSSLTNYLKQRRGESSMILRPGLTAQSIQLVRTIRGLILGAMFPSGSDFITAASTPENVFYLRCLFSNSSIYDTPPTEYSNANVVFPLQYEPEASLLYFAPDILNQVTFVEMLLRALPPDKLLWVKEHPNQFGALGLSKWQELKKLYSNLRFLYGRQSGREIMKQSSLVVSIASTAGMDGLLLGRRVIVAGDVFYRKFTGAIPVSSYRELADALNTDSNYILGDTVAENISELIALGKFCYPGNLHSSESLYSHDNLKCLVNAITYELSS